MIRPPVPENENLRLEILNQYKILDTLPEPDLDELVLLASQLCATRFRELD
jgi:hypothetical protein